MQQVRGSFGTHEQGLIITTSDFSVGARKEAIPTCLSQVEQCNVMPPTADRINRMAELLGENPDEWNALAGRVSEDISQIISEQPTEVPDLLRAVRGLTPEQLRKLREDAERMKKEGE